ncbi:hypothetical protein M8J77_003097 [Diaphorina citri]|nr:hypothetical protein M8J77_003097 [Diaphorina citri]
MICKCERPLMSVDRSIGSRSLGDDNPMRQRNLVVVMIMVVMWRQGIDGRVHRIGHGHGYDWNAGWVAEHNA